MRRTSVLNPNHNNSLSPTNANAPHASNSNNPNNQANPAHKNSLATPAAIGLTPSPSPRPSNASPLHKIALNVNRNILTKNVTVDEAFLQLCVDRKLLSSLETDELRQLADAPNRMSQILDRLLIQGVQPFNLFCEILSLTGNPLISDHLIDVASGTAASSAMAGSMTPLNLTDLWEMFPAITNALRLGDKEKLAAYLSEKVQQEIISHGLRNRLSDKERVMDAKMKQVEQSWQFQNDLSIKDKQMESTMEEMAALRAIVLQREEELAQMRAQIQSHATKSGEEMKIALQHNLANDSALRRQQDQLTQMEQTIEFVDRVTTSYDEAEGMTMKSSHHKRSESVDSSVSQNQPDHKPEPEKETDLPLLERKFDFSKYLETVRAKVNTLANRFAALQREVVENCGHLEEDLRRRELSNSDDAGRNNSSGGEQRSSLSKSVSIYLSQSANDIKTLRATKDLYEKFMFNQLTDVEMEHLPEPMKHLKLPGPERRQMTSVIEQLQTRVHQLEKEIGVAMATAATATSQKLAAMAAAATQLHEYQQQQAKAEKAGQHHKCVQTDSSTNYQGQIMAVNHLPRPAPFSPFAMRSQKPQPYGAAGPASASSSTSTVALIPSMAPVNKHHILRGNKGSTINGLDEIPYSNHSIKSQRDNAASKSNKDDERLLKPGVVNF